MKNEVYEKMRSGEISVSLYDAKSPLPEEAIILVEENSSDYRTIQFVSMQKAVKDFSDADENEYISFTLPRYLLWYSSVNKVKIVASGVTRLM